MKPQERRMTERARVETPTLAPRGRLLPASQAAVRIGIGYDALMSVIKAGKIAIMRHDSGRLMGIYENDLDEWVAAHRTPAADVQHEPSRVERRDVDRLMEELVPPADRVFGGG